MSEESGFAPETIGRLILYLGLIAAFIAGVSMIFRNFT
jgi:hypothetical protein